MLKLDCRWIHRKSRYRSRNQNEKDARDRDILLHTGVSQITFVSS